jgi:hypothetical protein
MEKEQYVKRLVMTVGLSILTLQTRAAVYIANDVAVGGSATVLTAGKKPVKLTTATFSASDCGEGIVMAATRQMLSIGLTPITGYLGTGVGDSFTLNFVPAVVVKPGDAVTFVNGDSTCKTSVTVQGK